MSSASAFLRPIVLLIAVLLGAVSTVGCSQPIEREKQAEKKLSNCVVEGVFTSGSEVQICGTINEQVLAKLRSLDWKDVRNVRLNSGGGEVISAIKIAKILAPLELDFQVEMWCLSSCAQYILPVADSIVLTESSIVGIHHTTYELSRVFERRSGNEYALGREAAELEEQFYAELNLDPDLLGLGLQNLTVKALAVDLSSTDPYSSRMAYDGPAFLLFDAEMLRTFFGVTVSGDTKYGGLKKRTEISISQADSGLFIPVEQLRLKADSSPNINNICIAYSGGMITCEKPI